MDQEAVDKAHPEITDQDEKNKLLPPGTYRNLKRENGEAITDTDGMVLCAPESGRYELLPSMTAILSTLVWKAPPILSTTTGDALKKAVQHHLNLLVLACRREGELLHLIEDPKPTYIEFTDAEVPRVTASTTMTGSGFNCFKSEEAAKALKSEGKVSQDVEITPCFFVTLRSSEKNSPVVKRTDSSDVYVSLSSPNATPFADIVVLIGRLAVLLQCNDFEDARCLTPLEEAAENYKMGVRTAETAAAFITQNLNGTHLKKNFYARKQHEDNETGSKRSARQKNNERLFEQLAEEFRTQWNTSGSFKISRKICRKELCVHSSIFSNTQLPVSKNIFVSKKILARRVRRLRGTKKEGKKLLAVAKKKLVRQEASKRLDEPITPLIHKLIRTYNFIDTTSSISYVRRMFCYRHLGRNNQRRDEFVYNNDNRTLKLQRWKEGPETLQVLPFPTPLTKTYKQ